MKSKNEWKEIDIRKRACYYFDDIINGAKINLSTILLNKKIDQNILVCNISYKTAMGQKPLRIKFDKIDGFIIILNCKIKH